MNKGLFPVFCGRIKREGLRLAVRMKNRMDTVKDDIRAMGTIEVVLIVAILVALAFCLPRR